MEEQFEAIVTSLREKGLLKRQVLKATAGIFAIMKSMAKQLAEELDKQMEHIAKDFLDVDFINDGENEFQVQFGEDALIFSMQTNVVIFADPHVLADNMHVRQDSARGYFGIITVHNFLAESVRYNRLEDAGILLARLMVNCEGHFYIEGMRMGIFYPDLSQNTINEDVIRHFLQTAMLTASEQDLFAPNYGDVQVIALGDKLADKLAGAQKVGFVVQKKENT
jgi:hypothetical protein